LIWEGAYRLIGWREYVYPAPSHVVDSLTRMMNIRTGFGNPLSAPNWPKAGPRQGARFEEPWQRSPLVEAQLLSLARLGIGFAISIGLGALLGLAMWRSDWLNRLLGPLFLGLQTLPSVCWVPLAVLFFGLREEGILFVLVMGSFFAIAIALRDGLQMIPPVYHRAGLMLGASGWRLYRYVLLPASLPAMAGSLRQGFSFAWRSLMGAELMLLMSVNKQGLGFLLAMGRDNDPGQVVAVMIVMVIVGMVVDRWGFAVLQKRVQQRFGLA